MELVLDLGNTAKKIGLFDDGILIQLKQFQEITEAGINAFFDGYPGISGIILGSVINHPPDIEKLILSKTQRAIVLDHHTPVPLRNNYQTPQTLGKDRLAAAVGGAMTFPGKPVLVINAGTAITYDFIDPSGVYQGGGISPGMQMRFRALHTFTGKLPLVEYKDNVEFPGNTTENSILSGVILGITAEMDAFSEKMRLQYPELKVILSGGDVNYFANRLKIDIFAVTNIVLHGLHQILLFNVDKVH